MNPTVKAILRNVAAVLTGLVSGVAVIMLVEMMGMVGAPPVPDPMSESMKEASVGALLIVELAYALGSGSAGWVAAKLGAGKPMWLAAATGAVLTFAGVSNLVMLPHPLWFTVVSTLTFIPMALLGGRLSGLRPPA